MAQQTNPFINVLKFVAHNVAGVIAALLLTLTFFLVLPIMQTIGQGPDDMLQFVSVDAGHVPPPPPPMEEPEEEEPEEEPPPPELDEEVKPLDLTQLALALNPGMGDGWGLADTALDLRNVVKDESNLDSIFGMSDLDQQPRAVYQPSPNITAKMRRKMPATVYIKFIVNERGRVENPIVDRSDDPMFNKAALAAIRKWKFEPGKRNGAAVRFRMMCPITFTK
jgi:protein TonB